MLILTRRIGEGVIIGDDIRVVVLEVRGKQFRLGIDAPTDVVVLRDEIFHRLARKTCMPPNSVTVTCYPCSKRCTGDSRLVSSHPRSRPRRLAAPSTVAN